MKTAVKTISLIALLAATITLVPGAEVLAQADEVKKGINSVSTGSALSFDSAMEAIVSTLLFIIGAVSVAMIIYGGFRYVTSGGEASAVKSAKDTITYAVIGLIVAVLAYSIASFVIGSLDGSGDNEEDDDTSASVNVEPFDRNQFGPTP